MTQRVLARLAELGPYRFSFVVNAQSGPSLLLPDEPVDGSTLLGLLAALPTDSYGDVYAELASSTG